MPHSHPFRDDLLAGRVVLVTGGGTGIGAATAELCAAVGARVVVAGRRPEPLAAVRARIEAAGGTCLAVPTDVREADELDALVSSALAAHGAIDVLVNNAGGQFVAPAERISLKGFRAVTRLDLDAVFELTRTVAVRSMLPRGYGKVVNVVLSPRRGIPGMAHSAAARAAVENLTRTLASEWGGRGIRLACVAPGTIDTEGWRGYGDDPVESAATIPVGRLGTAEEIAAAIVFLASPAGDFVTGTTLVVDGGADNVDAPPAPRP